ncbi:hypothetical protein PM8797T_16058 [Gimesia maris DSM 8797]|uniref:Uncharacterized protein n=1 Tax=Gimesia maris TaxID=122 RepID=A0ABX5YJ63_9PLAN|nr:hypothetical protein PM8797T_16058 [Gimesia maris DSM 8797]QDU13745.1 hypothetical protein CA11_15310 [Gimesia maris]QEG15713.1 hypothetical protein GmarT_15560 [Gimesia maris]
MKYLRTKSAGLGYFSHKTCHKSDNPALRWGGFVSDTLVVVPEELQFEPELAGLLPDASSKTEWDLSSEKRGSGL